MVMRVNTKTQLGGQDEKEAEWARLQDFFSRLASGDHKSLYEEVSRTPREDKAKEDVARKGEMEGARPLSFAPQARPSATPIMATTTPATKQDIRCSASSSSNGASSLSGQESCEDLASDEDQEDAPSRGRARSRANAGRFRSRPQRMPLVDPPTPPKPRPMAYTARFPGGSFASYTDRMATKERMNGAGGFTFKAMLHELYDDVDTFTKMIERVLKESRTRFRSLDGDGQKGKGKGAAKTGDDARDESTGNVEGHAGTEQVRRSVAERVAKKRRVWLGSVFPSQEQGAATSQKIEQDRERQPDAVRSSDHSLYAERTPQSGVHQDTAIRTGPPDDSSREWKTWAGGKEAVKICTHPSLKRRLSTWDICK
ncbi:hypothetical protein BDW22DRAFT_1486891 [Trametopsis cervina]|nr:hypothetical protein BDW22DRAFT_1486891 [Trametopsis cervina]